MRVPGADGEGRALGRNGRHHLAPLPRRQEWQTALVIAQHAEHPLPAAIVQPVTPGHVRGLP